MTDDESLLGSGHKKTKSPVSFSQGREMDEVANIMEDLHIDSDGSYLDITNFLDIVCSEFNVGQVELADYFSLEEAMSAIEIMNPKMDSGFLTDDFIESDCNTNSYNSLTTEQVIGIMDKLLACEMTWLKGQSLCQSIFSCTLLHQLEEVKNPYLRAFCLSLLRTCSVVIMEISNSGVIKEEFFLDKTDFNFYDDMPEVDIQSLLLHALNSAKSNEEYEIATRMEFRQVYQRALEYLDSRQLELALILLQKGLDSLSIIKETMIKGQIPPQVFDPKIMRKFASYSPPRPTIILDVNQAIDEYICMINHIIIGINFAQFTDSHIILNCLRDFSFQTPRPLAFPRCKVLNLLKAPVRGFSFSFNNPICKIFNRVDSFELVKDNLSLMSCLPLFTTPNAETNILLDELVRRADPIFIKLYSLYCHHPALKRSLILKILPQVDNLQTMSEKYDIEIYQSFWFKDNMRTFNYPLTMWACILKQELMLEVLALGFEFDLYRESEFSVIYWYMHYLHAAQVQRLGSVIQVVSKDLEILQRSINSKSDELAFTLKSLNVLKLTEAYHCTLQHMCRTMIHVLSIVCNISSNFRFQPLDPTPLSFSQYKEMGQLKNYKLSELLQSAKESLGIVKRRLEELRRTTGEDVRLSDFSFSCYKKNIDNLLRWSISVDIFLASLRAEDDSNVEANFHCTFDWKYHYCFPIINKVHI